MKEGNTVDNRARGSKFADQNQAPRSVHNSNVKSTVTTSNGSSTSKLRSASTWGSNIVKGLSGERKSKLQPTAPNKKVHPHGYSRPDSTTNKKTSSGTHDLFQEIENLRGLLKESKQRELKLQAELLESKRSQTKVTELARELDEKKFEVDELVRKTALLETENRSVNDQLLSLRSVLGNENVGRKDPKGLEMELVELRRLNKELQFQKRDLTCRITSMESRIGTQSKAFESDVVAKIKAEASLLKHTNEDLSKQVEGLQLSRLNEVEELAYLRWVNSCLRNELSNISQSKGSEKNSEPESVDQEDSPSSSPNHCVDNEPESLVCSSVDRPNAMKKIKRCPVINEEDSTSEGPIQHFLQPRKEECIIMEDKNSRRISFSGLVTLDGEFGSNRRRQSDSFMCLKETEKEDNCDKESSSKMNCIGYGNESSSGRLSAYKEVEKRALRIPNPPPKPSSSYSKQNGGSKQETTPEQGNLVVPNVVAPLRAPPPPPPPPLRLASGSSAGSVQRAPQVVEFYHSLMKRDLKKDNTGGAVCDASEVASVRSNMIDEIETRSSHLLAIKEDVETQGDFVKSLIKEVNNAVYTKIEDVVAFVKWLDDELSFLVDERAVLKHFDWPERKADALREAAFGFQDLKRLESEVIGYIDDPRMPCEHALKKMVHLSEKMERKIYNLLRTREQLMHNCKQFRIPTEWMLDSGIISKVKLGSVKLAKRYMNRIAVELQSKAPSIEKDPAMDYMLLQGVRFAFRIHQFAGGFDAETMQAFEQLRNLAQVLAKDSGS